MGRVYLVGAGPGDAGLITVKGMELIKQCDALVYDRLASDSFLQWTKPECRKIYVGKQPGHHSKKQEEINRILKECAGEYEVVVRLKGGDPFVFGRGGEEIEALKEIGASYEVVPGVTSAIAVPEAAGIPVTHRGLARSFHVITGHTKEAGGKPDCDYNVLAKTEGTLVFLMGLSNLELIAQGLLEAGKPQDTPAAVISEGTTKQQKIVRAPLGSLTERVRAEHITSPAVIVIGATADCRYHDDRSGVPRIGIVATKAFGERLRHSLSEYGYEAEEVCRMEVCPTEAVEELKEELAHPDTYQWVLFTSQNGVTLFFTALREAGVDIRTLSYLRFAVLGSGTAERLAEYGIHADFIPSVYNVETFAEEFARIAAPGMGVLIPRAVQGSPKLTEYLQEKGIACRNIPIYDVKGKAAESLSRISGLDCITFASASGVAEFFRLLKQEGYTLPETVKTACIGEATAQKLRQWGREPDMTATVSSAEGLAGTVRSYYKRQKGSL